MHATVTASSPAAVQALTASTGDLRRSLEAQGFTVLGLDVGQAGTEDKQRPDGNADAARASQIAPASQGDRAGTGDEDDQTTTETVRVPAAGSSVDVLV